MRLMCDTSRLFRMLLEMKRVGGAHVIISSHLIGNLESLCDASVLLTRDGSRVVTREMGGGSKWIGNVYAQLFKTNDNKN